MFKYVIKRVLIFIPTLLIISIVIFMLSLAAPGDPVEKMLGATPEGEPIPPQAYNETRKELGLDLPVFYFAFTSKAYPDTMYRIPIQSERNNLNRLVNEYGNWTEIDDYYKTAKVFYNQVNAIEKDSLNPDALIKMKASTNDMFINYDDNTIQKAFVNIEKYASAFPSTARVLPKLNEVKDKYATMRKTATPWKKKVPRFSWYGFNNQYHRWLFGNRPLFLKKDKLPAMNYALDQSASNTITATEESYHRFKIKVPRSSVKRSSQSAEILAIKDAQTNEKLMKISYAAIQDGKETVYINLKKGQQVKIAPEVGMIDMAANCSIKADRLHEYNPNWSAGFIRFDFGKSFEDKRPISEKIGDYLFWTMIISIISIILTYLISVPLGVFSARKKGTKTDSVVTTILFILYSLPSFWVATLLITFLCQPDYLNWFPPYGLGNVEGAGFFEKIGIRAYHLVLPLFCWTYGSLAFLSRQMRGGMLSVLRQDYVRTARAKGLEEKTVIWKHAFRNSLLPIITLFANIFPLMISGSIVIEIIFTIPGMGRQLFEAIKYPDYPFVFAVVLMSALLTMIGYLIADILYAVADPRITYD